MKKIHNEDYHDEKFNEFLEKIYISFIFGPNFTLFYLIFVELEKLDMKKEVHSDSNWFWYDYCNIENSLIFLVKELIIV